MIILVGAMFVFSFGTQKNLAEHSINATNLDLVGLAQTGVEYVLSVSSVAKALDLKFFTLRIM